MFNTKHSFVPCLFLAAVFGVSAANAQSQQCYTVQSFQGSYGLVANYGDNYASGLWTELFDGKGNLTQTGVINQPQAGSTTGQRSVDPFYVVGTYTVNCDGSGTFVLNSRRPDGSALTVTDDFVITKSIVQNGQLLATAMAGAQRDPSAVIDGGIFITRTHIRRPIQACFNLQSLQGSYGVFDLAGGHVAAGLEAESFDGKGNLTRSGIANQPIAGSPTGLRTVSNIASAGTYTVNCDGSGKFTRTVTRADGTKAPATDDFVITEATVQEGQLIATAITDSQREPSVIVPGGVFVTRFHTQRAQPPVIPITPVGQTVAVAGPKNAIVTSRDFQLDGLKSTSADGKPLTYLWSIPQGQGYPAAGITRGDTPVPTVQFGRTRGLYTFQLTVADSTGKTATDTVTINYQGN